MQKGMLTTDAYQSEEMDTGIMLPYSRILWWGFNLASSVKFVKLNTTIDLCIHAYGITIHIANLNQSYPLHGITHITA